MMMMDSTACDDDSNNEGLAVIMVINNVYQRCEIRYDHKKPPLRQTDETVILQTLNSEVGMLFDGSV